MESTGNRDWLVSRAKAWVGKNECPLPVDLLMALAAAGVDPEALEEKLLHGENVGRPQHEAEEG